MAGLAKRVGKRVQKRDVAFVRRKRFQQGCRFGGFAISQFRLGIQQRHAALLRRQCVSTAQEHQSVLRSAAGRRDLPGTQKRSRSQRILAQLRCRLRHSQLPRHIVGIELRRAFPTEQRILSAPEVLEHLRGFGILFHRFVGMVLLLLQERVSRDAFRRLRGLRVLQKAVEDREGLRFILGFDQQVKQITVINRRALRLILPQVQIAQRLARFRMLRG